VALFVAELSFGGPRYDEAVMGILAGSLISGLLGAAILRSLGRPAIPTRTGDTTP
jgi:Na+/H+ antiporter NhaA